VARHHHDRRPGDTPSDRLLLAVLALDAVLAGRPVATVVELAGRALRGFGSGTGQISHSPPLAQAAYALIIAGDYDGADAFLSAAVRVAQARGSVVGYASACCWRSHLEHRRGA